MSQESRPAKKYRVKLGFNEVEIEGCSKEEAIRLARIEMSVEMPLLYDVIHGADDKDFLVDEIETDSSS